MAYRLAKSVFASAGMCFVTAQAASAQEAPADRNAAAQSVPAAQSDAGTAPPPEEATPSITVTGQRKEVSNQIDRRTYSFRNDPDAQTGVAADLLGKLPSVQVTPTGAVTLRGDGHVQMLIDGKYPVGGNAALQTLSAADIDRIEVMTNPSTQYAPDGTAGIINIITKKRHPLGIRGSLTARVTSLGQINLSPNLTFSKGPWTLDGRINYSRTPQDGTWNIDRTVPIDVSDRAISKSITETGLGKISAAYKVSDSGTFTVQGQAFDLISKNETQGRYRSDILNFDHTGPVVFTTANRVASATYEYNNAESGDHLTLDLTHADLETAYRSSEHQAYATGDLRLKTDRVAKGPQDTFTGDYERHFASGRHLTGGLSWDRNVTDSAQIFDNTGTVPTGIPASYSHDFSVGQTLTSGYVTYQFPVGTWTLLPGLRLEAEDRRVSSLGTDVQVTESRWFPSLHLEHALSEATKLKLSYSRRVQRPDLAKYDPGASYVTPTSQTIGNPNLRPSQTDSLEAEIDVTRGQASYEAAVFYRETSDVFTDITTARADGFLTTQPMNAGSARSGGAEVTLRGPLSLPGFAAAHWKYSINANLTATELDRIGRGKRTYLSANGNGMIQYDATNGDQFQANLTLTGRDYNVQGYVAGTYRIDLSYQHPVTKVLSFVASVTDLTNSQRSVTQIIDIPGLKSVSVRTIDDQVLRLGVSWKFGMATAKKT